MMLHMDRDRWVVRCDGVHTKSYSEDARGYCRAEVEGPTPGAALAASLAAGFTPLPGGRFACPAAHKRGIS
jgi:hypothetical protein